jgi:hypothetical protein
MQNDLHRKDDRPSSHEEIVAKDYFFFLLGRSTVRTSLNSDGLGRARE